MSLGLKKKITANTTTFSPRQRLLAQSKLPPSPPSRTRRVGFTELALPQVPLTTLNAVISLCALADTLYPTSTASDGKHKPRLSRKEIAVSIGLMNGVFCLFGSMPNCHGAGGLAGQHKFGARNGASIMFLGLVKMAAGVLFGAR